MEEGSRERRAGVGNKAPRSARRRPASLTWTDPARGDSVSPTARHLTAPPPKCVCVGGGGVLSLPKRNSRPGPGRRQFPAALEQNSPLRPGKLCGGWQRVLAGVGGKRAPTESARASPPPGCRDLALASPPLQGVLPSPAAQTRFLGAPLCSQGSRAPRAPLPQLAGTHRSAAAAAGR